MNDNNNFFIVGAQRSGTTWLYRMLQQHPQIALAEPCSPEAKYFLQPTERCNLSLYFTKYLARLFLFLFLKI